MPATLDLLEDVTRGAPSARAGLNVKILTADQIDPQAVARWRDLARRSCHANPFLLPDFVLPAWKHLTPERQHVLLIVESPRDRRWLAAGGFRLGQLSPQLPLPHALASDSHYTFRTGLLLDSDRAAEALDTLFSRIARGGWLQHGIEFPGLRLDSILVRELVASTRRLGYGWHTSHERQVPAVYPEIISTDYLNEHWTKSRRKSIRRSRSRLEAHGPVLLRFAERPDEVATALEKFLRLEYETWKGAEGTACLSNPRDEAFVREMVAGLARFGHVVISELRAGDRVAASAINLTAGSGLFAFKIGWDMELASASPGVLHEAELMLEAQHRLRDFTLFDSCATETSYIAPIWPERISVATGLIYTTAWSRWCRRVLNTGRNIKRLIVSWW